MQKLFFISNSLPYSPNGSGFFAENIIKTLKKRFELIFISLGANYCSNKELLDIHKKLKKQKFKYIEINNKKILKKNKISFFNLFKKSFLNKSNINDAKKLISKISINSNDIVFSYGSLAINAVTSINCKKIALFEDLEDQAFIYRTIFNLNKFNFFKILIKLILIKAYYFNYYNWINKISKSFDIKYTLSPFDFKILRNYIYLKVLPFPLLAPIKQKEKKEISIPFNITMLGSHISKDYKGIILLKKFLIPKIIEKNLIDKVKINLIMRTSKNMPQEIEKILKNKSINLCKFKKKVINQTDMLFYPSKYPVGIRTKILYAFSKSWYVATSETVSKCIPDLRDFNNCIMSDDIDNLCNKIIKVIQNQKKFMHIKKKGNNLLKKYSKKKFLNILNQDLKSLNF